VGFNGRWIAKRSRMADSIRFSQEWTAAMIGVQ